MCTKQKAIAALSALACGLLLAGCVEILSWSPDGRYLVFVGPDQEALWRWDSETGTKEKVFEADKIGACRYLTSDGRILVGLGDDPLELVRLDLEKGTRKTVLEGVANLGFDVAGNGQYLYAVIDDTQLVMKRLWDPGLQRVVYASESTLGQVAVRRDREQALVAVENGGILLLDLEKGAVLERFEEEADAVLPTWLDDTAFVYLADREGTDDYNVLMRGSVGGTGSRVLSRRVRGIFLYSVSPDAKTVAAVVLKDGADEDTEDDSAFQIGLIDTGSGATRTVTDDPLGAGLPTFSPDGKRVAYTNADPDKGFRVTVLDLETGTSNVVVDLDDAG